MNVNMVSASTCQDSSFRYVLSWNRNSSDGTVTRLCARRLDSQKGNKLPVLQKPPDQFWGLPSLLFNKHQSVFIEYKVAGM